MSRALRAEDPRRIGPYRLHSRLGGGGMGQVYLGRSPGGRAVAVKVVRPELADDIGFRRRFAAEVEAARRVGGFYTAQVLDSDTDADPPWLATAYIPGPSLYEAVETHGPLPAETVAALGAGLAEGLAAVHACRLVHRDLKPGNVILGSDGPRLIDFGIARALDATSYTQTRTVMGTAGFMSPEQATGARVGPASDVFSLACVLTYAATGHSPFGTGRIEAVAFRVVHAEADLTGVPARLVPLLAACLAKEPDARPGVAEVLELLAGGGASTTLVLPREVTTMVTLRETVLLTDVLPPGHSTESELRAALESRFLADLHLLTARRYAEAARRRAAAKAGERSTAKEKGGSAAKKKTSGSASKGRPPGSSGPPGKKKSGSSSGKSGSSSARKSGSSSARRPSDARSAPRQAPPARPKPAPAGAEKKQEESGSEYGWWLLIAAGIAGALYVFHDGFSGWVSQALNDGTGSLETGDCVGYVPEEGEVEVPCWTAVAEYSVLGLASPPPPDLGTDLSTDYDTTHVCTGVTGWDPIVDSSLELGGYTVCVEAID
ncbi:serine/threonine protein kinase [Streptomonospora sp. S1-112]|uniref:Serine/threonine protein kinase n=1 Tax=Streptomonospora mangrovi TaxID=2883123 RepID=A0A9X3NNR8_9ACTN|nr:serine/threonine-protein kinase [Streptomonospora mangrovi]MDA0563915.1 serine/threonine protein kinase [Streptomonospora mangrovi]